MIDSGLLLTFATAVVGLMLIPGPNVALITANSVAYGPKYGFLTLSGTSSAMVVQLCLTALGMTELLGTMGVWFGWLRWFGVFYLIYLGVAQWRAPVTDLTRTKAEPKSARAIYTRGLLVSLTNPKTLFFYSAFFPQFVVMNQSVGMQLAVLSVMFVIIALVVDSGWVLLAHRARGLLATRGGLRNRVTGGFLIGAGAVLALARNK